VPVLKLSLGTWENANATSLSRPNSKLILVKKSVVRQYVTPLLVQVQKSVEIAVVAAVIGRLHRGCKNGRTINVVVAVRVVPWRRLECVATTVTRWLSRMGFGGDARQGVNDYYCGTHGGGPRKHARNNVMCVNAACTVPTACAWKPVTRHHRHRAIGVPDWRCVWGGGTPGMYVTKFSTATLVARVRLQPSFVSRTRRRRRRWRASSYHSAVFLSHTPPPSKPTSLIIKITRFHGKTLISQ